MEDEISFCKQEKDKIIRDAVQMYGYVPQIMQTFEEMGELIQAINKAWKSDDVENKEYKDNLVLELAQVILMLNQITYIFGISHEEFSKQYKIELYKLKERLAKRG
jgi:NTP pyrophosphatase (non-canonical NTP hydrolase)